MSSERRRPDRQQTDQPSSLERAFGFVDPLFREYISMKSTKYASSRVLTILSSEMSHHTHPLVRYASGWVSAEAGMLRVRQRDRDRERSYSLPGRLSAIEAAKNIWQEVKDDFQEAQQAASSSDTKADYLGFQLRAEQALAYIPSMRLAATLFSGREVPEEIRDILLRETRKNLTALGKNLTDLKGHGKKFLDVRSGVRNEILSGLLLQEEQSPRYVILPASLRQDNNSMGYLRSDLVAVSLESPYPKKLIQVTSGHALGSASWRGAKMRFIIKVPEDITLPGLHTHAIASAKQNDRYLI
ncbi:MAG TPA: hypothetical protein VNW29_00555 [Candidatus Sulfotelmatobacter sp.]|jgi:hypothetical protein|nr:hypothetical protein [Candidatus Sulfotelmatobacter sp.]